jgi:hypothetical protein
MSLGAIVMLVVSCTAIYGTLAYVVWRSFGKGK